MACIGLCVRRFRNASWIAVLCGALAISALTAVTPHSAQAQTPDGIRDESPHDRPQMVSVFTGFLVDSFLSYGFPLVIGGRYYYPIVPNGFIPSINDEFGLEGGLDLLFLFGSETFFGFGIPVDALWDFHFSATFDAYFKVGFEVGTLFGSNSRYGGFWWDFRPSVGMRLRLTDMLYFRAEAGWPSIMAGLGFAF